MRTLMVLVTTLLFALAAPMGRASPLCGTTLAESLTLIEDLDCTGFPGTAITIGASGVTFDGAGYRIVAPDAAVAVRVAPGLAAVAVRNLDLLGWCTGIGLLIEGGTGHSVAPPCNRCRRDRW